MVPAWIFDKGGQLRMIHEYELNGLLVKTGDLICTVDKGPFILGGQFWRYIGNLIPGEVGHVSVYTGPEGRCVETGAKGRVITFCVKDHVWDAVNMRDQRGEMADILYGIARPARSRGLSESAETEVRENVARYCLAQAEAGKPYNLDLFDANREDAFYCSQLVYVAYLKNGIDLNTKMGISHIPRTSSIIFPQELWNGSVHERYCRDGQGAVSTAAPGKGLSRLAG
jgi:hypothetical protein